MDICSNIKNIIIKMTCKDFRGISKDSHKEDQINGRNPRKNWQKRKSIVEL